MVIHKMGPCFFKPLIGNFAQKLLIPPAFVKKFKGKLSSNPLLKCVSEKSYTLETGELEDGLYFINGWQEYVKDHQLDVGDFIIFKFIDEVVFEVVVYDPTMCEKSCCQHRRDHANNGTAGDRSDKGCGRTKNRDKEIEISDSDDEPEECSPSSEIDDASSFKLVITDTDSHKTDLPLPTWFVREALEAGDSDIVLRDRTGTIWPLEIIERTKEIVHFTGGWIRFYIENKLKKGDTCIFRYKRRSEGSSSNNLQVIQVRVKHGRGRPPKTN